MLLCYSLAAFAWHAYQVLPDGRPLPGSILFNFTPEEVRAAGDLYHKLNPKLSPVSSHSGQHQQMQQQVLHPPTQSLHVYMIKIGPFGRDLLWCDAHMNK